LVWGALAAPPVLQVGFCGRLVLGVVFLVVGIVMMIAGRQPKAVPAPVLSAAVASAAKTCPCCGANNPPDNVFCEHCGTPLA
jgi:hypothetical protein